MYLCLISIILKPISICYTLMYKYSVVMQRLLSSVIYLIKETIWGSMITASQLHLYNLNFLVFSAFIT